MSLSTERSLRRAAALLLALLCLLSLAACGSREEMAAPELLEPRGVALDVAPVSRGSIQRTVIYEGVVLPGVRELAFASSGRVTELLVCPGSRVKAGDVIARLDVARTADALAAAESRLAYAEENEAILEREQEIRIELSKLDLQDLKNSGAGSTRVRLAELRIEEQENSLGETRALWALDKAEQERAIGELRSAVERSLLVAPCDGTVVTCTASEGSYAIENAAVIRLAEDAVLYLSVAEVSAAELNAAEEVYATVAGQRVEVRRRPEGGKLYAERDGTSAFEITDAHGVKPESGQAVVLFAIYDRQEDVLLVPSSALHKEAGVSFVYKIVDGAQVRQTVQTGVANDAEVQILSGLEEGELVYAGT